MSWLSEWLRRLLGGKPPAPPPPPPQPPSGWSAELLRLHDAERSRLGLPPLRPDARLAAAAQGHAARMARLNRLDHYLDGLGPEARIMAAGYPVWSWAENIAEGQGTPAEVLAAWLSSPSHRVNALGPYADAGFGAAGGYWCAAYANPR